MAILCITDLTLKTTIGIFDWERNIRQKVIINIEMKYNATQAIKKDSIDKAIDYKALTKEIATMVKKSRFLLLERLTDEVLKIVMANKKIQRATIRIDKPGALKSARSVSVELSATQKK